MIAFTFEIEYRVGDVFQGLWASDRAFFGDMANDEDGGMGTFCHLHKLQCAFANLADAARGGCQVV